MDGAGVWDKKFLLTGNVSFFCPLPHRSQRTRSSKEKHIIEIHCLAWGHFKGLYSWKRAFLLTVSLWYSCSWDEREQRHYKGQREKKEMTLCHWYLKHKAIVWWSWIAEDFIMNTIKECSIHPAESRGAGCTGIRQIHTDRLSISGHWCNLD